MLYEMKVGFFKVINFGSNIRRGNEDGCLGRGKKYYYSQFYVCLKAGLLLRKPLMLVWEKGSLLFDGLVILLPMLSGWFPDFITPMKEEYACE